MLTFGLHFSRLGIVRKRVFGSALAVQSVAVALVALQQMSGAATFLRREVLLFMSSDELYPVRIEGDASFLQRCHAAIDFYK